MSMKRLTNTGPIIHREAASRIDNQDMANGVKLAIEVLEAMAMDKKEHIFACDVTDVLKQAIKIASTKFPTEDI